VLLEGWSAMTIIVVRFTDYKILCHHGKDTTQIV